MEDIQVVTQDFVNIHITKSDSEDAAPVERRFKKGITVLEFKVRMIHTSEAFSDLILYFSPLWKLNRYYSWSVYVKSASGKL